MTARSYDKAGNTTGNSAAGETWGYGYDGKNRMTVVQRDGSTVAMYTYNAFGERVAKAVTLPQTINERFVYNEASQLIAELGSTNKDYIWLGDLPIGVVDTVGGTSAINYVTADELNTPRAIADESGRTVWTWSVVGNPFGEQPPTSTTGYVYNPRFLGQYFDQETGFNYNVQRYYDAPKGGYTQVDLIGFSGGQTSLYVYGNNNPSMYVDPYGLYDLPSIPQPVVDFSAGMGDTLSFGITNWARNKMGTNDVVNQCSTSYSVGEWTGIATSTVIGGAAGWRAAGTKAVGKEFSHWIPNRMGGPRSLWNGNYVTPARHYYHDPFRYPSGWRGLGDKWPAWVQQLDRIPNVYKGSGAGAAAGVAGVFMDGSQ
jgi:RHS repeat-associated protein